MSGFVPDTELTSERQQLLALLPATMPQLEEAFDSMQTARDCIDWGLRTKRIVFDRHAAAYVAAERGGRRR